MSRLRRKVSLLSGIITVVTYACLVIMLMITLAVLTAVGQDTGNAKECLEKTSIAVMMFSYPPFGGSSGKMYICMTYSAPKSHSSILMSSDVICELPIRSSLTQV